MKIVDVVDLYMNLFKKKRNINSNYVPKKQCVFARLSDNINYLQKVFCNSEDIVYREFKQIMSRESICIIYIDGMANTQLIDNQIIKPVITEQKNFKRDGKYDIEIFKNSVMTASNIQEMGYLEDLVDAILSGDTVILLEGLNKGIVVLSNNVQRRQVGTPTTEQTIRGPQEGFVEDFKININLIRKRIKDSNLSVKLLKVGRRTQTDIGLIYIDDVVNKDIVENITTKIETLDVDGVVGSAQIEQLIQENRWTVLPQMMATERPDRACGKILEGRIVIIVDGSPFVMVAPTTFAMLLNSPDDYYERVIVSSFFRFIRYLSFIAATTLPGAYLALTAFHPGMLPTQLALSITGSRVGLPFPVYFEVLLMEFTLDILQEAAIRLPKPIGPTISIVGGIVIGQAVVQAGIVSPIIVIVVSMTAISAFVLPIYSFTQSTRVIRFFIIFAASVLGLYGVVMAWIFLLIHFASVESFGVRYMGDYSPYSYRKTKDTLIKLPESNMNERPENLPNQDTQRKNMQSVEGYKNEG